MVRLKKIPQRLKDIKDFVDEYIDFSDEPVPGLIPIGDTGLFRTPDEPADPQDCDRYPDSPFCGGNPFTKTPIGLEPQIIISDCDIGVRLNPILGFIKLPPVNLVYRKPECRSKIHSNKKIIPPDNDEYSIPVSLPSHNCYGKDDIDIFCSYQDYYHIHEVYKLPSGKYTEAFLTLTIELLEYEFPYRGNHLITRPVYDSSNAYLKNLVNNSKYTVHNSDGTFKGIKPIAYFKYRANLKVICDDYWKPFAESFFDRPDVLVIGYDKSFERSKIKEYYSTPFYNIYDQSESDDDFTNRAAPIQFGATVNNLDHILKHQIGMMHNSRSIYEWKYKEISHKYITQESHRRIIIGCIPIPPPPPKEICCMPQCCPPPDNALLKLLLKKVKKLSEAIGVDELPAALPKRIIYPNGKGEEKQKNLVEILGYQVKQIDRAVGLLPQKIKVADTNPGLAGNQSVEVEIHSFADFAKEILQLLLDTEGDVDTTNNMLVRVLYELGFIHQGVVQGDAMLDAIIEFLDFKQKWKKLSVPFAFDPHAGTKGKVGQGFAKQENTSGDGPQTEEEVERLLPALLQNTEVDIRILVNDEKKSLNDILQDIKRDTAIAAAAVSENADSGKLDQLVAAAQLLLQLEGAIDRKNIRQALTSGNLRTAKNNGT